MLHLKRLLFIALLFLPLFSCSHSPKRGSYFPEDISGERVAFYTLNSDLPSHQYYLAKDYLYTFCRDGSYSGTFDGNLHELGTHSYQILNDSNRADLKLSSSNAKEPFSYTIHMIYDSAYAGSWEITYVSETRKGLKDMGTFRFIK